MPGCTRLSGACGGSLARACVFSVLVFSASKARAHTQYIGHLHLPDLRESLSTSLISRASLRLRTKEDTVCLGLSLDTAATAGAALARPRALYSDSIDYARAPTAHAGITPLPKPRLRAADLAPPVEVAEMEKVHELHAPLLLVREAPARTPPARARRRGSVTVDRVVGTLDARAAVGGGLGGHHIGVGRLPRAGVVGRGGPGVAGVKTAARAPPSSRRRGGVGSSAGRPHTVGTVHTRFVPKKGKRFNISSPRAGDSLRAPWGAFGDARGDTAGSRQHFDTWTPDWGGYSLDKRSVLFSLPRASWPARALRLPRGATRWTSEPAAPRHCTLLAHAARHRRRCACFLARRWTSAEKTASLWGPDSAKIARAS